MSCPMNASNRCFGAMEYGSSVVHFSAVLYLSFDIKLNKALLSKSFSDPNWCHIFKLLLISFHFLCKFLYLLHTNWVVDSFLGKNLTESCVKQGDYLFFGVFIILPQKIELVKLEMTILWCFPLSFFRIQAHTRSSSEVSFGSLEDNQVLRNSSHPFLDKGKKHFNLSYNKSVGGGKDGINGTTHIAQLHDVLGYAHLVDENNPPKQLEGDKPISDDAHSKYGASDRVLKAKNAKRSKSSLSSSSPDKEYSKDVLRNRSPSHSSLLEGYEFGLRTEPSEVQPSTGFSPNFGHSKGNSGFVVSPSKISECGVSIGSPSYFDDEVDANSVAAASADAVRKAIEKAQASIKIAKELMERRKDAFKSNAGSKGLWKQRREHIRASKLRDKESQEQRPKEYGKLNSTKMGCQISNTGDHVGHSDNIANCTARKESGENETYDQRGEAVERDGKKLSGTISESDETEAKALKNRQGNDIKKMQLSEDCGKLQMTTASGSASGTVQMIPLQQVNYKTENKLSTGEGAHECESYSEKLEPSRQLQHVERDEVKLEVKGEQCDSAEEELTAYTDQVEYCGKLEEIHESLSEINLDESQLEETMTADDCVHEENEAKQGESHEAEGNIKSSVISDDEENCGCKKIDGEVEKEEREGESCQRECGWEKNEEKPSKIHEGEGNVRSRKILDGEDNITCEKIDGKEENGVTQGESCGTVEYGGKSEGTIDKQENKDYSGFNLGADAKQWLDHMKEILHVRINSFFDATENSRHEESNEMVDNHPTQTEGREEIQEEVCGIEAIGELHETRDSVVDENIRINIDVRIEGEGQDVPDEGKVNGSEELTGTMEVAGDEENKESVCTTGDEDEIEMNEVRVEETNLLNLSVEEKEVLISDAINLNEGEVSNLSAEEEDNLSSNLEEMCGSEASDLSGVSLEADTERQVQDAMEVIGFCEDNVKLGFTGIKFGFSHSDQYAEESDEFFEGGKHAEGSDSWKDRFPGEKGAEILSKEEEEAENMLSQWGLKTKVSDDKQADNLKLKQDQLDVACERKEGRMKINQETTTFRATDREEENCIATKMANEKETEDCLGTKVEPERDTLRKIDEIKERERERDGERETEREREKERLAVERAIREARGRAFAEARERAERASVKKVTAEARQRVMAQARDKLGKASSETLNKPAEKTSVEARLRAERAAVERATAEARERALEKAMSGKSSGAVKDYKVRQKSSYVGTIILFLIRWP